jgi:hypothetical protein
MPNVRGAMHTTTRDGDGRVPYVTNHVVAKQQGQSTDEDNTQAQFSYHNENIVQGTLTSSYVPRGARAAKSLHCVPSVALGTLLSHRDITYRGCNEVNVVHPH